MALPTTAVIGALLPAAPSFLRGWGSTSVRRRPGAGHDDRGRGSPLFNRRLEFHCE
jgi:hypothetical protein